MTRRLAIVGTVSLAACGFRPALEATQAERQNTTMQETERFSRTISQIAGQVKSLDVPDELFASKEFIAIYESPQAHLPQATLLVARRDVSAHEKLIIGYAMQRLPAEQFAGFLSSLADSVEQGLTEIRVLEKVAFAPLNFGYQPLLVHYSQRQVQAVLIRLMNLKVLPAARKAYIRDRVLTGQANQEYRDYMEALGRPVRE